MTDASKLDKYLNPACDIAREAGRRILDVYERGFEVEEKEDRSPLTEADGVIYAGCYVNASIEFWAQDNNFGKRINAQLRGVQFNGDGDAFSAGRPADADEFEEVSSGTDAGDFA